jgi:hypothetical protein
VVEEDRLNGAAGGCEAALFVGCNGIDPEAGLTTPNLAEVKTNQTFINLARRVVVLADHTEWGVISLASFAALKDIHVLVTDAELPPRRAAHWARGSRRSSADALEPARQRRPARPHLTLRVAHVARGATDRSRGTVWPSDNPHCGADPATGCPVPGEGRRAVSRRQAK